MRNYRRVLDYDPNNEEAIDALEILYRQMQQWRDLVDVLRLRVRLTEELGEKKELLSEVADLWKVQLQDPPEAIQVYNDILELDNNDLVTIRHLASLYENENHNRELAELWERELELLDDSEEIIHLRFRLGLLYGDRLRDQERSLGLFQQVLEENPDHTEAIQRTETLLEEDEYRLICARILEPIYLHQENYAQLRGVYKIQLEDATQTGEERRNALLRLGLLHEEQLGEYREAYDRYYQVFREKPGHPGTRDAMLRMAEQLDIWPELLQALESGVTKISPEEDERVPTHLVLAEIYRDRMQNPDRAIVHYRQVVDDLAPENLVAIESLEAFYNQRQQWAELIEILFQKEQALDNSAEKKAVFNQVAQIYEQQLQDNSQAILILKQYLSRLENEGPPTAPGAAEVEEASARQQAAETEINEIVEAIDLVKESLQSLEEQFSHSSDQLQAISTELEESPEDLDLQSQQLRLQGLSEAAEAARVAKAEELELLRTQLDAAEEAEAEANEALRNAEARRDELAAEAEQEILQHNQFQLDTIRDLARLFEVEQRWPDLVEILEKEVALLDDEEQILELRYKVAELWEQQLQEIPRAIQLYRSILNDDPDFEQALEAMDRISENDDYQLMVAESLESYFREGARGLGTFDRGGRDSTQSHRRQNPTPRLPQRDRHAL